MADYALNTDSEEWRQVVGWPYHEVSSLGRVRSLDRTHQQPVQNGKVYSFTYKGKVRSQSICSATGYSKVGMQEGKGKRRTMAVHVMVCEAFHGKRPTKHDVAHANGNKSDNRAENLRWATRKDNLADRALHGTLNSGERNGMTKISDAQFDEILKLRSNGVSVRELAGCYGVWTTSLHDKIRKHRRLNEGR